MATDKAISSRCKMKRVRKFDESLSSLSPSLSVLNYQLPASPVTIVKGRECSLLMHIHSQLVADARARALARATIKVVGQNCVYLSIPPVTIDKHVAVVVLSRIAACQTAPMYTAGSQCRPAFAHGNPLEPRVSVSRAYADERILIIVVVEATASLLARAGNALISSSIQPTELARIARSERSLAGRSWCDVPRKSYLRNRVLSRFAARSTGRPIDD